MVMGTIKIDDDKNAGKLLAILITMPMRRYDGGGASPDGAHPGLHSKPLVVSRVVVSGCVSVLIQKATLMWES